MEAITAHKTPEKVADGTCTRVWAWMTDKCRKKMNGGIRYITIEISQRGGGRRKEKEPQEKERGPWDARGVGDSSPRARVLFSLGPLDRLICTFFPLQNKPSLYQSLTSGPTIYKFIVMGPV